MAVKWIRKRANLNVRLEPDLRRRLEFLAASGGERLSEYARDVLANAADQGMRQAIGAPEGSGSPPAPANGSPAP